MPTTQKKMKLQSLKRQQESEDEIFPSKKKKSNQVFIILDETIQSNNLKWKMNGDQLIISNIIKNSDLYHFILHDPILFKNAVRLNYKILQENIHYNILNENISTHLLDREFFLKVVKQNGRALYYASERLKSDREIVLQAVKQDGIALQFAFVNFKSDREIVLQAVKQYGNALQFAFENLKSDREIVLQAVKKNGLALQFASVDLQSDREVVLQAV